MRISRILVYGEPACAISVGKVAAFLQYSFGVGSESRPLPGDGTARASGQVRGCRIQSLYRPHGPGDMGGDGVLHDAGRLLEVFGRLLSQQDGTFHIMFTDLLMGSYEHDDMRYHARALLAANPALVSIPGIIEAPARPREYCIEVMLGADVKSAGDRYQFLDYGDPRLQPAAEGYAMQAVFYFETGQPFCATPGCRLFNAHWQAELIRSQVPGRLCGYHQKVLDAMHS